MAPPVALRAPCVAIYSGILSAVNSSIGTFISNQGVGQIWVATMGHFSVAISNLSALGTVKNIKTVLGKRIGAVWALSVLAQRLGITRALGADLNGKLALVQVVARIIDQGSRLSAVRFAQSHAVCEVIGVDKLDEDDWLGVGPS